MSYVEIGRRLDLSKDTVATFCRRNGLGNNAKHTLFCKNCGKPIQVTPHRKPKKFCSDACRTAWWNSHPECVNRKAIYHFVCACCGKNFTAYGNRGRKYCSHACYIAHRFGGDRHG